MAEVVAASRGVRLKLHAKLAAFTALAKMLGLFTVEKEEAESTLRLAVNISSKDVASADQYCGSLSLSRRSSL